jgi:hypothetical protein
MIKNMSKKTNRDNDEIFVETGDDRISMIAEISTSDDSGMKLDFDKEVAVLPLRNMVMFPHMVMPITIGRSSSLKLVNAAYKKKQPIASSVNHGIGTKSIRKFVDKYKLVLDYEITDNYFSISIIF